MYPEMRLWSSLPEEVLSIIFNSEDHKSSFEDKKLLEKEDIFQCELVCRNWKSPAQRAGYNSLTLDVYTAERVIKAFKNNPDSPGKYVRELFLPASTTWEPYLFTIVDIFPFIDTLETHEPNSDFYSALISIRNMSKWEGLKNFQYPNLDQDLEMYATCALQYKVTLEHLLVCDKIQFINANNGDFYTASYFTLLEELQHFPKIKELVIKRHTEDCLESFDRIIEKCQNLKKLDIGIYPEFDTKIAAVESDLFQIVPRPNIKTLDGQFVVQDDNTLLYIMHKFPCLENLFINHSWRDDFEENGGLTMVASNITIDTFTKFISFITPIPSCVVSIYITIPLVVDAFEEYTRVMSSELSSFLSISYAYNSALDSTLKQHAKLTMHRTSGYKTNQDHEFFIDYNSIADTLAHLNVIEKIGSSLAELTYRMNFDLVSKENNKKAYDMIHGYFLDHIFYHCPRLKKLRLSSTKLLDCNPALCSNNSMSHLVLLNCYIGKDILSQLSKRIVCLTKMIIVRCNLENPYGGVNTRYYHIDMPSTAFDVIRIKSVHTISLIGVKLNRGGHDEYYKLLFDTRTLGYHAAEKSTRFAYELMSDYEKNMKVYIRCSNIRKIQLFMNASVDGVNVAFGEIIPL